MGFKEAYLLGCDCDYNGRPHFHNGKMWDPDIERVMKRFPDMVFPAYEIVKQVFEEDNRKIINCTVGGNLEVFERVRLEEKVDSLINEIDRLREPPLVVAVIVKIHEEPGKVIVLSSTGPMFVVAPSRKIKNQKLEPGMFVSLNQRTFAIMEILSLTKEDIMSARSHLYKEY